MATHILTDGCPLQVAFPNNALIFACSFSDSEVAAICRAPGDYPSGKEGDVLTVEFTVCGVPFLGLNGGPQFKHTEAFSFQIATDTQAETDRYWNAIVSNGGEESACGWCKDRWGISWQITPRVLMDALAAGGAKSLSENSELCCFRAKDWMARRDEGEYPLWVFD